MEYRRLGKSGLKVSEIGLGCASPTFVGKADEPTSISIINHALELGINYIDTAETYAMGRSETLIGKALQGKRSQVIIGTKFGKDRSVGPAEQRGSRTRIMNAVEGSLKRLQTDYIDLYIMHEPDPETPIEETLRALDDLVRAGKVRYLGCSDFAPWQLSDAMWTSKVHNLASFTVASSDYNVIDRRLEKELLPCCLTYGVGIMPLHVLAGGFLTGKYRRGEEFPQGTRFGSIPPFTGEKHQDLSRYNKMHSESYFDKLDKLQAFAQQRGHSVGELAIAWMLAHPWVGTVLTGVSSSEQLTRNVAGLGWKLSAADITQLDKLL